MTASTAREAVEAMCTTLGLSTVDMTDIHINPAGVHAEWLIRDDQGDTIANGDSLARRGEFIPMDHPEGDHHLIAIDVPTETVCCSHIDGECFTSFDCVTITDEMEIDPQTDAGCECDHGDAPQHWPGDSGAVIDAHTSDRHDYRAMLP